MNYQNKYLKYKSKYLKLLQQFETNEQIGGGLDNFDKIIKNKKVFILKLLIGS